MAYFYIEFMNDCVNIRKQLIEKPNREKLLLQYNYMTKKDIKYNNDYNWNNLRELNDYEMKYILYLLSQISSSIKEFILQGESLMICFWLCNGEGNCPFTIINDVYPYNHIILSTIETSVETLIHELLHIHYKKYKVWKNWYNRLWNENLSYYIGNETSKINLPIRFNPDNLHVGYYKIKENDDEYKFLIYPVKEQNNINCKTTLFYYIYDNKNKMWCMNNKLLINYILQKYFSFPKYINIESPDEIWVYLVMNQLLHI